MHPFKKLKAPLGIKFASYPQFFSKISLSKVGATKLLINDFVMSSLDAFYSDSFFFQILKNQL